MDQADPGCANIHKYKYVFERMCVCIKICVYMWTYTYISIYLYMHPSPPSAHLLISSFRVAFWGTYLLRISINCQATRVQLDSDSQAWLLPARVLNVLTKKRCHQKPSYCHKITQKKHWKSVLQYLCSNAEFCFFFWRKTNWISTSCFRGAGRVFFRISSLA